MKNNSLLKSAVVHTAICLFGIIFLFVKGFFSYCLQATKDSNVLIQTYNGAFTRLAGKTSLGNFYTVIIIGVLIAIIVCEWVDYFRKKQLRVVGIVCSATALGLTFIGSIAGKSEFFHMYSPEQYRGTLTYRWNFEYFGIVFYLEILLLIALLVISILKNNGKIFAANPDNEALIKDCKDEIE